MWENSKRERKQENDNPEEHGKRYKTARGGARGRRTDFRGGHQNQGQRYRQQRTNFQQFQQQQQQQQQQPEQLQTFQQFKENQPTQQYQHYQQYQQPHFNRNDRNESRQHNESRDTAYWKNNSERSRQRAETLRGDFGEQNPDYDSFATPEDVHRRGNNPRFKQTRLGTRNYENKMSATTAADQPATISEKPFAYRGVNMSSGQNFRKNIADTNAENALDHENRTDSKRMSKFGRGRFRNSNQVTNREGKQEDHVEKATEKNDIVFNTKHPSGLIPINVPSTSSTPVWLSYAQPPISRQEFSPSGETIPGPFSPPHLPTMMNDTIESISLPQNVRHVHKCTFFKKISA
ncbi:hypothetical protein AX774_g4697 [Zancudomyces culisetae]|uniref:Uncharacterized protein n=1 Tax=Zancudomyces culisetae TaxID=1213189 RepID=A0A1R1PLK2_ZANCU|nr:hypothetical protein AX774_g4697 [Zancudomyces culisetae]|eukprot:OMH81844.1 hypothetical protein AX774_g4697 [Zancudomyces culisetae]